MRLRTRFSPLHSVLLLLNACPTVSLKLNYHCTLPDVHGGHLYACPAENQEFNAGMAIMVGEAFRSVRLIMM